MENLKKLVVRKARVKNFLSYGNEWQELSFSPGLTIVQGFNVDTGKSNGSGKSSITEIIPFALFGKTIKDLPQTKVINWNNKSGCEVELSFGIGGKSYVFKRGLKPNKFTVTCDGLEVVRTADIRIFQQQMEDEVIGMDFKTFKNLIYFSPNNTISILGAKKEQKRLFLESLFDLSEYSDMLKAVNEKIKVYSERVSKMDSIVSANRQSIEYIETDIKSLKTIDITCVERQINTATFDLDTLKSVVIDDDELKSYDDIKISLEQFKLERSELSSRMIQITSELKHIKSNIEKTNIASIREKRDKIVKAIDMIQSKVSYTKSDIEGMYDNMASIRHTIKEEMEPLLVTLAEEYQSVGKDIGVKEYMIKSLKKNLSDINKTDKMDGVSECPLCKSEVDHGRIEHWCSSESERISAEIDQNASDLESLQASFDGLKGQIESNKQREKDLNTEYDKIKSDIDDHTEKLRKINELKSGLELLPNVDELQNSVDEYTATVVLLEDELKQVEWKISMTDDEIAEKEGRIKRLDTLKKKIDDTNQRIRDREKDLDSLMTRREELIGLKKEQDDQVKVKMGHITKYNKEIEECVSEMKKNNRLIDHLSYLRVSLKDENVKQFAISALLPYLNHRANHYLSESGFPYVVEVDGWLEVVIRGMGTDDVGYNSLSGGESKAMDMAIQLACNDIAELQAKTSLGISIYDEILDTSLDSDGVQRLMSIIRVRQSESGDCVLCISHRDEIKDLDFDNSIMINKKDGFSTIQA